MSSATKVKTHSLLSGNLVEEDEKNLSVPKEAQVDDDDNNNNVKDTDLDDDDILNIDDNDIDATELMDENDNSDSSSSNESSRKLGDISYHPTRMIVLYSPPVQRQYWDMEQVLPRVNWGDLFFDLFYVAATYNVSNIIVLSPDRFGFLYSIGTYWPLQGIILHRTTYDARFVIEKDDVYHRLFQIVHFLVLSIGVLTIRSVDIMSHPKLYSSMFTFALSLVVERIMVATRYIEVYFTGIGQPTLKVFAKREILNVSIALPFYIAATIIAGIEFFHNNENNSVTEYGYNNVNNYNATTDYNMTSKVDNSDTSTNVTHIDGGHMLFQRWLAGGTDNKSKDDHSPNHAPIYLLLFGYIASVMFYGLAIICCLPSGGRHKEISIPLNINFMIHRHSEWIMLNLGESIFSLLIIYVPDEGNDFYTTFYCSLLTVMLLHVLHFKSQPMHADHHAWRRSKNAGFLFFVLTHMYTLGLVSLGAAYTFFLLEANNNNNASDEKHRYLMMQQQQHITYYDEGNDLHRWLADTETNVDSEKYEHQIARLFCITLALIFASLDLMTLSHLGFEECEQRCYHKCPHTKAKKLYNIKGYVLIFFRIAIIFFTATMDLWERNVKNLSIAGLLLVFAQIMLRVLGAIYLGKHKKHQVHVAAEE